MSCLSQLFFCLSVLFTSCFPLGWSKIFLCGNSLWEDEPTFRIETHGNSVPNWFPDRLWHLFKAALPTRAHLDATCRWKGSLYFGSWQLSKFICLHLNWYLTNPGQSKCPICNFRGSLGQCLPLSETNYEIRVHGEQIFSLMVGPYSRHHLFGILQAVLPKLSTKFAPPA